MQVKEKIHGFEITRVRDIKDCGGTLYEMVHEKTNAQLCYLKRDDQNKTFSITFKTLPSDDTGVFHILEHSVLNGSEKYPVKEPFVELLKGSMQTFLNAFTSPDRTTYPVSSRNDKDFMNLMSVYMDAVFCPLIYKNPNIFYQEGWHYEINDANDEPTFNGVVLNEMKGAYSSVDETLVRKLNQVVFPDNCYKYESGGEPSSITDLTYEKFIETHKRFYHPSNARVFLDGNIENIDEVLAFINDEYFSKYEKADEIFEVEKQEIKEAQHVEYEYEIAPEESLDNRTQIAFSKIISDFDDVEKNLAWHVLCSILVANNESKFKKAILENHLAEDVELDIMDSSLQPWVVLNLRNSNLNNYDEARKVLRDTAKEIVAEGLDKGLIKAALNQMEFRYKEKKELAGLTYILLAMHSWVYGGDPALYLSRGEIYETLREKADEGYFEKLVEDFFLDEEHLNTVIAKPSNTLAQERLQKEKEKLEAAKKSWDDVQTYIDLNKDLLAYQQEENSKEALATLPRLELSDINEKPEDYPWTFERRNGVDILTYPSDSSGIVYMNAYFSIAGITVKDLPKVALYTDLLTNLPTSKHTTEDLQKEIRANCGTLSFTLESFSNVNNATATKPMIVCHISALKKNLDTAISLAIEIMKETIFTRDNVLPHVKQEVEDFRQATISSGHSVALTRVLAHYNADSVFKEYTAGQSSGLYIKNFLENYDEEIDEFLNQTEMMKEIIYAKDRVTISLNEDASVVDEFVGQLNTIEAQKAMVHYPLLKEKREKVVIPGGVSFVGMGGNFTTFDAGYEAKLQVLAQALTFDYLWNEVRVKNGAYGCGFVVGLTGNYGVYSYSDPNPANTIQIIENIHTYLKNLGEQVDITQLIIGTLAAAEPLRTPSNMIRTADSRYFKNITYEDRVRNRKDILHTTLEDLKNYSTLLEKAFNDCALCVVGNSEALSNIKDLKDI